MSSAVGAAGHRGGGAPAAGVTSTGVRRHSTAGSYTTVRGARRRVTRGRGRSTWRRHCHRPAVTRRRSVLRRRGSSSTATSQRRPQAGRLARRRVSRSIDGQLPKANRLAAYLRDLHLLTPNRDELGALTDPALPVAEAAAQLHHRGVDLAWIRLGATARCSASGRRNRGRHTSHQGRRDRAGDAMLAAYCHAWLAGAAPTDAARYGLAAAALTIADARTVRPDRTDDLVESCCDHWDRPGRRSPIRCCVSPTRWPPQCAKARPWWRWRARSSATACRTRRTWRWRIRSRT